MKGTNTIRLNQATMCEAIDHYLTSVVMADGVSVDVTKVEYIKPDGYGQIGEFEITVTERVIPPGQATSQGPQQA